MTEPTSDDQDDHSFIERTCFVIMPFGEKINLEDLLKAATPNSSSAPLQILPGIKITVLDFDSIYKKLIKPAVEMAATKEDRSISCIKSDEVGHSGFIHREMLDQVVDADIVIVDITTQNANVFYELGIRHSFRRFTTILIQRSGTRIPFNIAGMRVFEYSDEEAISSGEKSPLELSRERLADIIRASFNQMENDSLVHNLLPSISIVRESSPIMEQLCVWNDVLDRSGRLVRSTVEESAKSVGYITGDILHIKHVDVWVNPENTKLQMARYHDGSVSSNIRYFGARSNSNGHVVEDTIADALELRKGGLSDVEPGVVIATGPGSLKEVNNVRLILHVAALQGEPGRGYQPIRDYPGCIRRALAEVDRLNNLPVAAISPKWWKREKTQHIAEDAHLHGLQCTTVLFPLFGSRTSSQHPQIVAENLYRAATVYLQQHTNSKINTVYFLAWTQQDRELCERALALLRKKKWVRRSGCGEDAGKLTPQPQEIP